MKLIQMNWNPSNSQLQQFGMISLFAFPGIAWLWGASSGILTSLLAVGLVFALAGLFRPGVLRYPFVGLCVLTIPIGLLVSELTLMLMFAFVFAPIGALFRVLKRDALALQTWPVESYWRKKPQPKNIASYYRQW